MQTLKDTDRFSVLYVDDEEKSLKYFQEVFGGAFPIHTASNAQEGFEILEAHKDGIGILMTDQRMPGEKGTELLERVRQVRPRILRFLVTAHTDLEAAIEAVNRGAIYKYITKPWDIPELQITLKRALEFFGLQRERDQLLREKLYVLQRMMISDRMVSLSSLSVNLSHHVRNAMFSIRAFLDYWIPQMLRDRNLDLEPLHDADFWMDLHPKVQAQAQKVLQLLTGLEEAALKPRFEYAVEIRLGDLATKAIEKMKPGLAQKQITIDNHIPKTLPAIKVDKKKFNLFFELLLEYEIGHISRGGTVRLTSPGVSETTDGQSEIQIIIEDNGPESSRKAEGAYSDPFTIPHQAPEDLSFNLMTCFFIIFHHGGTIKAIHNEGKGTRFDIFLPTDPNQINRSQRESDLLREMIWEDPLSDLISRDH